MEVVISATLRMRDGLPPGDDALTVGACSKQLRASTIRARSVARRRRALQGNFFGRLAIMAIVETTRTPASGRAR
jgi:hypothetical protein